MQKKYSESDFGSVSEVTSVPQPPDNEAKIKKFLYDALNEHGLGRGWAGVTFGDLKKVSNGDLQAIANVINEGQEMTDDIDAEDAWGWVVYGSDWAELPDPNVIPDDPYLYLEDGKLMCSGQEEYRIEPHEMQDPDSFVYFNPWWLLDGNSP